MAIAKKAAQIAAPAGSVVGQNNKGNGAVPWLYLETIPGTIDNYKSIYRVNTAGGSPSTDCSGMSSTFTVQYAAAYFIYK